MKTLILILSLIISSGAIADDPVELLQGMKIDAKEWQHPAGLNARKQINQYPYDLVVSFVNRHFNKNSLKKQKKKSFGSWMWNWK